MCVVTTSLFEHLTWSGIKVPEPSIVTSALISGKLLSGGSARFQGLLELYPHDRAHTRFLHSYTIDPVGGLDGSGIVGNEHELCVLFELL